MNLTDAQKKQIEEELAAFTNEYAGKTKEERKAKGQFFTPASLTIEMLEMFDCEEPGDQTILDRRRNIKGAWAPRGLFE